MDGENISASSDLWVVQGWVQGWSFVPVAFHHMVMVSQFIRVLASCTGTPSTPNRTQLRDDFKRLRMHSLVLEWRSFIDLIALFDRLTIIDVQNAQPPRFPAFSNVRAVHLANRLSPCEKAHYQPNGLIRFNASILPYSLKHSSHQLPSHSPRGHPLRDPSAIRLPSLSFPPPHLRCSTRRASRGGARRYEQFNRQRFQQQPFIRVSFDRKVAQCGHLYSCKFILRSGLHTACSTTSSDFSDLLLGPPALALLTDVQGRKGMDCSVNGTWCVR